MEKTASCISGLDWYRAGYWAIFAVAVLFLGIHFAGMLPKDHAGCACERTTGHCACRMK